MDGNARPPGMSMAKNAQPFDPDLHPWDRQPTETDDAYQMFVTYRDMPTRNMVLFDSQQYEGRPHWTSRRARELSSMWSWRDRCYAWDRYQGDVDTEEQARYRRQMNQRHRDTGRAGLAKMARWLNALDPTTLKPFEAARLLEVFARMEHLATGTANEPGPAAASPEQTQQTLGDMLDIDPTVAEDLARALDAMVHGQ